MTNMVAAYFIEAIACACLLMYVMVKYLEQQRAMKKSDQDPPWLRAARSTSFFAASCLMVFSAVAAEHGMWEISTPVLLLLTAIIMILAFNAISQHRRTPPSDNDGSSEELYSEHSLALMGYRIVKADIARLDQGQLLMIKMLEDIRNIKNLGPGAAIIDPNPVVVHPAQFRPRQ
jgi:hypothetical protein